MKNISKDQVIYIAKISKLNLSEDELTLFSKQLSETLDYIGRLDKLEDKIKSLGVTYQVTDLSNVYREDKIDFSRILKQGEALSNAKETYNGYFVVPGIFDGA
jgi:aspartyl-tRNA(Asn)/glutamyl-tRNA(Gln) amidotransferase subunit C